MNNLSEKEIAIIQETESCDKYQIEYYAADVRNAYKDLYNRTWSHLESAVNHHDLRIAEKYLKIAKQLPKINEKISDIESIMIKYGHINYFPQFRVLQQVLVQIINL